EAGALNVTVTPGTGLPWASSTTTTNGAGNAVATVAIWPEPETTVTDAGADVLASAKLAAVVAPAVAVTVYAPSVLLAVAVTLAWPPAMTAVAAESAAEVPVAGAAKLTTPPSTGSAGLVAVTETASG